MVTKYLSQFAYEVLEPLGIEYRTPLVKLQCLINGVRFW